MNSIIWDGKNEHKVMNFIFDWVNFEFVKSKGELNPCWTSVSAPVVLEEMTVTLKYEEKSNWGALKPVPIIQTFSIPKGATITRILLEDGRRWISIY